jgi:hypothetical protein
MGTRLVFATRKFKDICSGFANGEGDTYMYDNKAMDRAVGSYC